jgi:hypothetical protein
MRVICCYANNFRPETQEALDLYSPDAIRIDTSGAQENYWHAICRYWTGEEDLVIIEQDNVITASVIPSFEACSQDWCTFQYKGLFPGSMLTQSLGCTKFSAALQRRFPHEVIGINMVWHLIDFRIGKLFHDLHGLECHVHGEIEHLHDYKSDPLQKRSVDYNRKTGEWEVRVRQEDLTMKVWRSDGTIDTYSEEDW